MGFKIILTPQALADLESIVRFIAKDNRDRAREFGHELVDRAISLASLPERGRIVPEIGEPRVREIIHRSCRVIYEIYSDPAVVFALRFWHAARGTPEIK